MSSVPNQSRGRSWCFTWNNPNEDEVLVPQAWPTDKYNYLVYQLEEGEAGTPHLQGYINFKNPVRFSEFRTWFPGNSAHIAIAKGSAGQNKTYCTKEEGRLQGPWEFGTIPEPGKRNDLLLVQSALDAGATLAEISDDFFATFLRYSRSLREYQLLHAPPRNWEMEVLVVYGPTGTGKSRWALENHPGAYWKSKNSGSQQFWDGYLGESTIIIDEFYGWFSWDYLLRLLDRYPFSLDTKHGTVNCSARKIVFTSNKHPSRWYPNCRYEWNDSNPLRRRITEVRELLAPTLSPPSVTPYQEMPPTPDRMEEVRLNDLYLGRDQRSPIDLT